VATTRKPKELSGASLKKILMWGGGAVRGGGVEMGKGGKKVKQIGRVWGGCKKKGY